MLYVSGWLLVRQDPMAWQGFLKAKTDEAVSKQTSFAVAALAFLAVFREGAETVLFIHALSKTADGWSMGLIAGLLAASVGLVVLFAVINVIAQRLPLRPVFIVTSGFLFVTAIKLIGDAMQEFQEQLIIPYTAISGGRWLSALGLNPTLEAVLAQAAVILLAAVTVVVLEWRARTRPDSSARPTQASS